MKNVNTFSSSLFFLLTLCSYGCMYGSEVTTRSQKSKTALVDAIAANNQERVRLLIQTGADLNTLGAADGLAPLHIAVRLNHIECARLLLASGANADVVPPDGKSPLQYALEEGTPECITVFLEQHRAKFNLPDTVIMYKRSGDALREQNVALFKRWLVHSEIIIFGAILCENERAVNFYLGSVSPDTCLNGYSLLSAALHKANKNILSLLISYGADVNKKTTFLRPPEDYNSIAANIDPHTKHTPLFYACLLSQLECVNLLLNAGAEVNLYAASSPLWAACLAGQPAIVSLLIAAGANPFDEEALVLVCERYAKSSFPQDYECLTKLLDAGAHPSDKLVNIALRYKHHELLAYLLGRGANAHANTRSNNQTPPLSLVNHALSKGDFPLYALLRRNGARLDENSLSYALDANIDSIAQELLEEGAPLQKGCLHKAAARGSEQLVAAFLKRGVSLNQRDFLSGMSELGRALQSPSSECVRLLLNAGSDPRSVILKSVLPNADPRSVIYEIENQHNALEFALKISAQNLVIINPQNFVTRRTSLPNLKELIKQSFRIFRPSFEASFTARKLIWPTLRLLRANDIPLLCVIEIFMAESSRQKMLITLFLSDLNDDQRFARNRLLVTARNFNGSIGRLYELVASTKHFKDYDHEQFTLQTLAKPLVIEYLFEQVMACAEPFIPKTHEDLKPLFRTERGQQEIRSLIEQGISEAYAPMLAKNQNHSTSEKSSSEKYFVVPPAKLRRIEE